MRESYREGGEEEDGSEPDGRRYNLHAPRAYQMLPRGDAVIKYDDELKNASRHLERNSLFLEEYGLPAPEQIYIGSHGVDGRLCIPYRIAYGELVFRELFFKVY